MSNWISDQWFVLSLLRKHRSRVEGAFRGIWGREGVCNFIFLLSRWGRTWSWSDIRWLIDCKTKRILCLVIGKIPKHNKHNKAVQFLFISIWHYRVLGFWGIELPSTIVFFSVAAHWRSDATGLNLVMLVWMWQIRCEWAAHLSETPDACFNGMHSSILFCTPFPQLKLLPS